MDLTKRTILLLSVLTSIFLPSCWTLIGSQGFEDTFKQCLVAQQPQNDLKRCFGFGAISRLQVLDSSPEFDLIDGLTLSRDMSQEYREGAYNFADQDPSEFRSIVDTFDHVFSKRAMQWDLDFVYPGLAMRIAPSVHPHGILEFVMDPSQDALNLHRVKEVSTGRVLAKKFLVPLLLGFKFKVAALVPIIFGLVVLLAKKIVIISKIALIISAAVGLSSLLFKAAAVGATAGAAAGHLHQPHYSGEQHFGGIQFHPTSFDHHYKVHGEEYPQSEELQYRNGENNLAGVGDQLKLFAKLPDAFARTNEDSQQKTGRNFAWSEDENAKKKNET